MFRMAEKVSRMEGSSSTIRAWRVIFEGTTLSRVCTMSWICLVESLGGLFSELNTLRPGHCKRSGPATSCACPTEGPSAIDTIVGQGAVERKRVVSGGARSARLNRHLEAARRNAV